jgi:26S proteasome regulatory subunit N1
MSVLTYSFLFFPSEMLSATASLGLLLLWDVDGGLARIDKYLYLSEEYIKAGALLASSPLAFVTSAILP